MRMILPALLVLAFAAPAFAEEHMDLYPKGRETYIGKSEANAERYRVNGQAFVDNLYQYKGEGGKSYMATTSTAPEPMVPEADLDAYIDGSADLNVDTSKTPATAAPPIPASQ